ncbi:MAG: hypothetical protein R3Y36_03145 [Spirochaetales bacterium]
MIINNVYGNIVPAYKTKISEMTFNHYAKKNKHDPNNWPELTTVPYKNGFDDFGLMSVIEKTGDTPIQSINEKKGILLGTMRMGFGHYRMSLALASVAKHLGYTPYWFDMLSFKDTPAGKTIRQLEHWYNLGSRISQNSKFFNDAIWENITSAAGQNISSSVQNAIISQIFAPLFHDLPKNMPFLSTHPWAGHGAVQAGLSNIITIIPDNYPLAFHVVEGTVHAVQTPSKYMGYRTLFRMGNKTQINNCMPASDIFEAGHYIDHEIRYNIDYDCDMRKKRIADKKARRFLLTMGGAGAQIQKFADLLNITRDAIEEKKAMFFINMGDHVGRWNELRKKLQQSGIEWTMHTDWKSTKEFIKAGEKDTLSGVHVFLHEDFYAAVYTTNLLMRISDVMITKPSELSFYPVPKLFIHRVGRHEAWGAICSSECGDGTIETTSVTGLYRTLGTLINDSDILELYCSHITKNAKIGIYDGAYNSVKRAIGK